MGDPARDKSPHPWKYIYIYKNLHHNKVVIVLLNRTWKCRVLIRPLEIIAVALWADVHTVQQLLEEVRTRGQKNLAKENKNGKCLINLRESKTNENKKYIVMSHCEGLIDFFRPCWRFSWCTVEFKYVNLFPTSLWKVKYYSSLSFLS